MSEILIRNTSRVIFDSTWPAVEDALKQSLEELKNTPGKEQEYQQSLERYTGLTIGDVRIEPVKTLPTGEMIVCVMSRKTGFARVDVPIGKLPFGEILSRTIYALHKFDTLAELQAFVATNPGTDQIAHVKENDQWYGFIPGNDPSAELSGYTGIVYFNKGEWTVNEQTPAQSGHYKFTVTDPAVATGKADVFIFDLKQLAPKGKK